MFKSKLRWAALGVFAIALLGAATVRDPMFKTYFRMPSFGGPDVPATVTQFANALCSKDARVLADHSGGALEMTYEAYATIVSRFTFTCTEARYMGRVNGEHGPEYFFALAVGPYEIWYGFTYEPATDKVVNAE